MGSPTMGAHTWTVFGLLFIFVLNIIFTSANQCSCSCFGLANVRNLISDDDPETKNLLVEHWFVASKDVCRSSFQSLSFKSLGSEDLGTIIKNNAKEVEEHMENYFWKFWFQHGLPRGSQHFGEPYLPKKGMEEQVNRMIEKSWRGMDNAVNYVIKDLEGTFTKLIGKFNLPPTFALDIKNLENALKGLFCTWSLSTNISTSLNYEIENTFAKVNAIEGVKNVDINVTKEYLTNNMKSLLNKEVPLVVKTVIAKFISFAQLWDTELKNLQTLFLELQTQKNFAFETYAISLLKEAQKDDFITKLDQIFVNVCGQRTAFLNKLFGEMLIFLNYLGPEARQAVNENKELDFVKFSKFIGEKFDNIEKYVEKKTTNLIDWLNKVESDFQEGKYSETFSNYFWQMFPQTSSLQCPKDAKIKKQLPKSFYFGLFSVILRYIGLI